MALIEGIPGEFGPQPWGEAIQRGCELLLLRITRRPANHEVRLPGLATAPRHVVEDRTGRALTWRRDGDDLVVRLPGAEELPTDAEPVVRVALQGKLRIVPPDTSTANADGVWDLVPSGSNAHLVARKSADVAVRLFGSADPGMDHLVRLANQSYAVSGAELIGAMIGPFPVFAGRVVRLSFGTASVTRALVAPVGTVLASIHPLDDDRIQVLVTNFGRAPVQGDVFLPVPPGWSARPCQWSFGNLAPGATMARTVQLRGPTSAAVRRLGADRRRPAADRGRGVGVDCGRAVELRVRLDAGRRSASLPWTI